MPLGLPMRAPGPLAASLLLLGSLTAFVFSVLLFVEVGSAVTAPVDSSVPLGLGRFLAPVLLFAGVLVVAGAGIWAWESWTWKVRPGPSWSILR